MTDVDIVIVGGGAAGLSAAIEARMRKLSVLLIAREDAKGGLSLAPLIENYPACPNVTGMQLLSQMKAHAQSLGTLFHNGRVTSIGPIGEQYGLGVGSEFFQAPIVILATGARQPKLLPGEEGLIGKGVSYCATCDGALYRGKHVGMLGESAHAPEEANFLASIAASVVYFGKPDPALHPEVQVVVDTVVSVLADGDKLMGVRTKVGEYHLEGLFIERDQIALSTLIPGLAMEGAFIQVDRKMQTNLPGVYAAGDCTGGALQVSKAVGEGCVAAYYAAQALSKKA